MDFLLEYGLTEDDIDLVKKENTKTNDKQSYGKILLKKVM